jgi:preprotein translocase subunit SecB
VITGALARKLPRFEFIARFLVEVTRKKENRKLSHGYQVRFSRGMYRVVQTEVTGSPEVYKTKDPALLFDYVRRGSLGYWVRSAEEFRTLAHGEAVQS